VVTPTHWPTPFARPPSTGEHVTRERFDAGIAELRTEITALESRICRAMLVQAGAIVGALVGIAGIVVGALRLLG